MGRRELSRIANEIERSGAPPAIGGFRVVVCGKGGVGKTSVSALLCRVFARRGYRVLGVDADPQVNLPYALGVPTDREVIPLSRNVSYIEEKTGARPGEAWGIFLRINPSVDDVVDRFGIDVSGNVKVLVMGTVTQAATGCLCPENALLAAVVRHIALREDEVIIMDTQAGLEHFGRAIARGFRHCVVVAEPNFSAFAVASSAGRLARELGIKNVILVVNKVKEQNLSRVGSFLRGTKIENLFSKVFTIPYSERLEDTEPNVGALVGFEPSSPAVKAVEDIAEFLELKERSGG